MYVHTSTLASELYHFNHLYNHWTGLGLKSLLHFSTRLIHLEGHVGIANVEQIK